MSLFELIGVITNPSKQQDQPSSTPSPAKKKVAEKRVPKYIDNDLRLIFQKDADMHEIYTKEGIILDIDDYL
jgi:hypothetical protein